MTRSSLRAALFCVVMTQTGCGSAYYLMTVQSAEARVAQARAVGAETAAPYEYTYAVAHLREARQHASEASYGDAAKLAETAEVFAERAIHEAEAARRSEERR